MIPAETRSIEATRASTATGTTIARTSLREVAGERRLERVDAADGSRRHLGALGAVEGGRPVAEPPLDDVEPQVGRRRARPPAGRRPRSPRRRPRGPPRRRRGARAGRPRSASDAPSNPRAATRAISTAWARTSSAATTPRAASAARRPRTARRATYQARVEQPGDQRPTRSVFRATRSTGPSTSSPVEPVPEDVVRPPLVEEDDRHDDRRPRRSSPSARSARRTRSSTVRLLPKSGLDTITRG